MLNGKIYEVIIPDELDLQAHNSKLSREAFLESILNQYADAGYSVAGVWKDIIIMENFDVVEVKQDEILEETIKNPEPEVVYPEAGEKLPVFDDTEIKKSKEVVRKETISGKIKKFMKKK